jgi:hypothetical protein
MYAHESFDSRRLVVWVARVSIESNMVSVSVGAALEFQRTFEKGGTGRRCRVVLCNGRWSWYFLGGWYNRAWTSRDTGNEQVTALRCLKKPNHRLLVL